MSRFLLTLWLFLPLAVCAQTSDLSATRDIRSLIGKTYDQPGKPVETDPVVVAGDHAVADWAQGKFGGRALLRRDKGNWSIVLCAGDGLKQAAALEQAGVPRAIARSLAQQLTGAERGVPAVRLRLFSLFGTAAGTNAQHTQQHPAHDGTLKH